MKIREANLQTACINWFRMQHRELALNLFAIPNGGTRNAIEASNLKKQGVTAGVSDLILLFPNWKHPYLCIEMKVGRNKQTEHQKAFQQAVERVGGKYIICRSFEEFEKEINEYLKTSLI